MYHGHQVMVQRDGGKSIGLTNEMYEKAGARIVDTPEEIFARADMIIKSARTHEARKLERLRELIDCCVDLPRIRELAGISP